jgi:ribosome biogenesis GTPase
VAASPGVSGGLLADTPGLRELALWASEEGAIGGFDEIETLAAACRFRDCRHEGEPGCAVLRAVEEGEIDPARLASHDKLVRERARQIRQHDPRARGSERRWAKQLAKAARALEKRR